MQEKERQLLQSRISILLSQIQPHFLYNTLTVIYGLCDENPKEAEKVTAEFADYLQPIVENAVKHGVTKKKHGGIVTIATREQEDCYEITITDDGVGFDPIRTFIRAEYAHRH